MGTSLDLCCQATRKVIGHCLESLALLLPFRTGGLCSARYPSSWPKIPPPWVADPLVNGATKESLAVITVTARLKERSRSSLLTTNRFLPYPHPYARQRTLDFVLPGFLGASFTCPDAPGLRINLAACTDHKVMLHDIGVGQRNGEPRCSSGILGPTRHSARGVFES